MNVSCIRWPDKTAANYTVYSDSSEVILLAIYLQLPYTDVGLLLIRAVRLELRVFISAQIASLYSIDVINCTRGITLFGA